VYLSALSTTTWSYISPFASPARLKYAWLVEIDNRWLVGGRDVVNAQFTAAIDRIRDIDRQPAGKAHLTVGADIAEFHPDAVVIVDHLGRPDLLVKADRPAVQRVDAIVTGIWYCLPSSVN